MKMKADILRRILEERKKQDDKWGEQNHHPTYWLSILGEEYGELCKAINETINCGDKKGSHKEIVKEAIQVAAVVVAMIECIERNK